LAGVLTNLSYTPLLRLLGKIRGFADLLYFGITPVQYLYGCSQLLTLLQS